MGNTANLISELPEGILETILTKLPIRDAVRTCILSKQWRYKWTSLTRLVFDDDCVLPRINDQQVNEAKLVNFITRFLFLHNGPIHKFMLATLYFNDSSDINQWLRFISRKHVKELVLVLGLEQDFFRVPSCIFSFDKLTSLELARCELNLPPNFKGFLCLKRLYLVELSISSHDMGCLISSCPLLESLTLELYSGLELTIRAPNLKYLELHGEFNNVCLGNVPLLFDIFVVLYNGDFDENIEQSSSSNFDTFLGAVPNLERLRGDRHFIKYLSIGNPDGWNPITYYHLKFIELNVVRFDDAAEVWVVLLLIDSSPNLQELHISGSSNNITADATGILHLDFWEDIYTLPKLKTVKMTQVSGVPHEMKFIEYLLKSSPDLETMSITTNENVKEQRLNMLVDLVRFPRASPHASIICIRE